MKRCFWVPNENKLYCKYHDEEWGVPIHDDRLLFEMLILEGAQAGLSWLTVLKKRENYKKAFDNFNPEIVAEYDEDKINQLILNKGIIRHKLKIRSAVKNAQAFLRIQEEFGSFDNYIWKFTDYKPIINHFEKAEDVPSKTELSDTISKDLKRRGMNFVGSKIIYAFMQAVGIVNDHQISCFRYDSLK